MALCSFLLHSSPQTSTIDKLEASSELGVKQYSKEQKKQHGLTAEALFALMQKAYRQGNFEIQAIKLGQGVLEPFRITHAVIDKTLTRGIEDTEREHLAPPIAESVELEHHVYLNGPATEALKVDSQLYLFEQGLQPLLLNSQQLPGLLPKLLSIDMRQLLSGYNLILAGKDRVAGHIGQVIRILPKDRSLYPMQLLIDFKTYLPLRMDLLNRQEQIISQFMVVSLHTFQHGPDWLKDLSASVSSLNPASEKARAVSERKTQHHWQVKWLPKGFKLSTEDQHVLVNQLPVDYRLYSNGLLGISVYISAAPASEQEQNHRVIQSSLSLFSMVSGRYEVTVVGEIPLETAKRIAESVFIDERE